MYEFKTQFVSVHIHHIHYLYLVILCTVAEVEILPAHMQHPAY